MSIGLDGLNKNIMVKFYKTLLSQIGIGENMKELIVLEYQKFASQRNNWIILGVIMLMLSGFITSKARFDRVQQYYLPVNITYELQQTKEGLVELRKTFESMPTEQQLAANIRDTNYSVGWMEKMLEGIQTEDWNLYLENKIAYDQNQLIAVRQGRLIGPTVQDLQDQIELNGLLLEGSIKPIYTDTSMEMLNYLTLLLSPSFILFMLIVTVFISSSMVSSDFEKKTYKLLYTQPLSKTKIMMSKLTAALSLNYLWIFTLIGGSCVMLSFIFGVGDSNYPIKLYENELISYSTMGHYLVIAGLMLFLLVTFTVILTLVISTLTRYTSATLITGALFLLMPNFLNSQESYLKIAPFNPVTYIGISDILQGIYAREYQLSSVEFSLGFVVLSVASLLLFGVLLLVSNRMKLNK